MLLRPRRYEEAGSPFPHWAGCHKLSSRLVQGGRGRRKRFSLPGMAGGSDGDEVLEVGCGGGDPGAYAAVLKRELDMYCAAVAKAMEAKSQESSLGYPNSQASDTSQLISQASFDGNGYEASLFTNSHIISNNDSQGNLASTCISKKQSDDDDLVETTNPTNAKKMRRMLSNRESAKRSRKKKQTHLDDLQSQVSRLTAENASLLKRLTDMTQKYKDASTNNWHHIADVEMMRRKVHIAEEAVRRVTGASMLVPPTMSDMHVSSMPLTSYSSNAPSVAAAIQESIQHFAQEPLDGDTIKLDFSNETIPQNTGKMFTTAVSLCRVASLENLQKKRVHQDSIHFATALPLQDREPPIGDK